MPDTKLLKMGQVGEVEAEIGQSGQAGEHEARVAEANSHGFLQTLIAAPSGEGPLGEPALDKSRQRQTQREDASAMRIDCKEILRSPN
jgi:hypothetical protein